MTNIIMLSICFDDYKHCVRAELAKDSGPVQNYHTQGISRKTALDKQVQDDLYHRRAGQVGTIVSYQTDN